MNDRIDWPVAPKLPRLAQVVCNERMVPDARTIAPSPEASFMGLPVRVNSSVPDGCLVLVDGRGKIFGVVTPVRDR